MSINIGSKKGERCLSGKVDQYLTAFIKFVISSACTVKSQSV